MRAIRPRFRAGRLLPAVDAPRPRRGSPLTPERRQPSELSRARSAGGPHDLATYACGCGYLFSAPVSTGVCCSHCGGKQAW